MQLNPWAMNTRIIHEFLNGVKIFDDQLLPEQRTRYGVYNVHEAQEEEVFLAQLRRIRKGGVFVNIGSAIGYYALLARRHRSDLQIVCVEPLPIHIAFFRQNIGLNGLDPKGFVILEAAVARASGYVYLREAGYSSTLAKKSRMIDGRAKVLKVRSYTLLDLCAEFGGMIDLVQMDVQGEEYNILNAFRWALGSAHHPVESFLIGTHGATLHQRCKQILEESRYVVTHDEPVPKLQPDGILAAYVFYNAKAN
jgi:FkbM family methyltransferase